MVIKYVHKLGNENKEPNTYQSQGIPDNIIEIITTNPKFSESCTFGQKGLGEPDEIELLSIISDGGEEMSFSYYNKGIHYMMNGHSEDQPIFQVFTYFMMLDR